MDLFPKRLTRWRSSLQGAPELTAEGHDIALGVRKENAAVIELVATPTSCWHARRMPRTFFITARKVDEYNQMRAEHAKLVAKMNATVKTVFTGPVRRNTPLIDAVRRARIL